MRSSKRSGIPSHVPILIRAPPAERSSTTQSMALFPRRNTIFARRSTCALGNRRLSVVMPATSAKPRRSPLPPP